MTRFLLRDINKFHAHGLPFAFVAAKEENEPYKTTRFPPLSTFTTHIYHVAHEDYLAALAKLRYSTRTHLILHQHNPSHLSTSVT